ncbi:MAG: DUF169 domain-containing protein [Moorellales bacterium]
MEPKTNSTMTRREFLRTTALAGAVAAGAGALTWSPVAALAQGPAEKKEGKKPVGSIDELRTWGEELEKLVWLRTTPIALKMLKSEREVPEGAIRPKKDRGEHLALCQALAVARRQGLTLAMFIEDHWCFEPIISLGLVRPPDSYLQGLTSYPFLIGDKAAAARHAQNAPRLPYGEYRGLVCGPLKTVNYEPDLIMIYCNTGQLRHLLLAIRYKDAYEVTSTFDPIGSCTRAIVPPLLTGECQIAVPDPGDYERAMAGEDEMILTVPRKRLEDLMLGLHHLDKTLGGYKHFTYVMRPDFPQPPFYQEYFKMWGLDAPK